MVPRREAPAWVVLLRGANVGGRVFRPRELAESLPAFSLTNLGAAGTFVARTPLPPERLSEAIAKRLPFETQVMVLPGSDFVRMVDRHPFPTHEPPPGVKMCLTVLHQLPPSNPRLPLQAPGAAPWEVQVLSRDGRYVFSHRRRLGDRLIYPNEVIEKAFKVPATTREWPTVRALAEIIRTPAAGS